MEVAGTPSTVGRRRPYVALETEHQTVGRWGGKFRRNYTLYLLRRGTRRWGLLVTALGTTRTDLPPLGKSRGPQSSDTESTKVRAVLKTQISSSGANGNSRHCHSKRFTIEEFLILTPEIRTTIIKCLLPWRPSHVVQPSSSVDFLASASWQHVLPNKAKEPFKSSRNTVSWLQMVSDP